LLLTLIAGAVTVYAAFPGANGKIVFASNQDGTYQIYVMNADGTGQTNLTTDSAFEFSPAWSPDGSKIAFYSDQDGNTEIYAMNADGTGQTRLTTNSVSDFEPAWSPDGTKIVFISDRDQPGDCNYSGNCDIYVMNADGSGVTRLTNTSAFESSPAWSPDGTKIAFSRAPGPPNPGGPHEIYVMNADGSGYAQLSPSDGLLVGSPDWSPDGTKIAYVGGFGYGATSDVYVINANGSGRTNLTPNTPGDEGQPAWSPDGAKIAFTSGRDGNAEIYVMNADGNGVTRLTNNPATDTGPDWQPIPPFNFSGFFQPVDNLPTLNVVKAGQAIPVKFSLNGDQGLNIFAAGYPGSQIIQCDSTTVVDGIEETVTAGSSSLSYDPSTDTYTYVWKTNKAWANSCRQLVVKLNDGSYHQANFKFK
jgi:Tol biopolymer transport system component